jgi:RND family efflux transporter MFP subunit
MLRFQLNLLTLALSLLTCQCGWGQSHPMRSSHNGSYSPDGVLEPWRISEVACVETGLVKRLHVVSGARVQAGEKLAELDTDALEMQIAVAEAQAAAVGRQAVSQAELQLQERRVLAIREARQQDYSSQLELERAEADLRISQARLASELEEQQILKLQAERLKQQLRQRVIEAPFAGIVVHIHKEVGELVAPNTPELVRLVDATRLRTSFFLQVDEVRELPVDGKLQVRLNDGSLVDALLEHVAPVADSESGLIEVRVLIENPALEIRGSRCSLILHGSQI